MYTMIWAVTFRNNLSCRLPRVKGAHLPRTLKRLEAVSLLDEANKTVPIRPCQLDRAKTQHA